MIQWFNVGSTKKILKTSVDKWNQIRIVRGISIVFATLSHLAGKSVKHQLILLKIAVRSGKCKIKIFFSSLIKRLSIIINSQHP